MSTLRDQIRRLIEIHTSVSQLGGISEGHLSTFEPELKGLKEWIIEDLVLRPGLMVYLEDPIELRQAREAVDTLWDTTSSDEIWDEIMSGGFGGLLAEVMGNFSDRVRASRPTFVSVEPTTLGFGQYMTEAFKCWLYGLNGAAVLICHSLLETVLFEAVGVTGSIAQMAKEAMHAGLISKEDRDALRKINRLRNGIAHSLDPSPDTDLTNEILVRTRDIVERLLQGGTR